MIPNLFGWFRRWGSVAAAPAAPGVLQVYGSYAPVLSATGSVGGILSLTGSYAPVISTPGAT